MNNIINFINNNAIVASLITLFLTTIIQIAFRKSDRRYNESREVKKESIRQFENKAEFIIDDNKLTNNGKSDLQLLMINFKTELVNEKKEVEFYYPQNILDNKEYRHFRICLKNIGNADVKSLYICSNNQKNTMLCNVTDVELFVNNKLVNYSVLYDRKIMKNKCIILDIAYLANSKIFSLLSSELSVIFIDSYGNLYEQALFVQQRKIYEPVSISYKDYKIYTQPDVAIECFKKPWLW